MNRVCRVCLSDAPGQGTPPGRGDVTEGLLAISLCVTVLGHRNIERLLALLMVFKKRRRKKTLFFGVGLVRKRIYITACVLSL